MARPLVAPGATFYFLPLRLESGRAEGPHWCLDGEDFSTGCCVLRTFMPEESASRAAGRSGAACRGGWWKPNKPAWGGAAGRGRGRRGPAWGGALEPQPARQASPCAAADAPAPAVSLAYPRALACPRREPEPLAEVAAWSPALNENAVGGCLRGPARHGRCGVSSVWGRSRRLLRLKPGPEAGTAGVAVCRSP